MVGRLAVAALRIYRTGKCGRPLILAGPGPDAQPRSSARRPGSFTPAPGGVGEVPDLGVLEGPAAHALSGRGQHRDARCPRRGRRGCGTASAGAYIGRASRNSSGSLADGDAVDGGRPPAVDRMSVRQQVALGFRLDPRPHVAAVDARAGAADELEDGVRAAPPDARAPRPGRSRRSGAGTRPRRTPASTTCPGNTGRRRRRRTRRRIAE